jgi:hypothetical protein
MSIAADHGSAARFNAYRADGNLVAKRPKQTHFAYFEFFCS